MEKGLDGQVITVSLHCYLATPFAHLKPVLQMLHDQVVALLDGRVTTKEYEKKLYEGTRGVERTIEIDAPENFRKKRVARLRGGGLQHLGWEKGWWEGLV